MRRILLVLAAAICGVGAAPMDDPIARDRAKLEGPWAAIENEAFGQTLPYEGVKDASLCFRGNTVVIGSSLSLSEPLPYTIDPSKNPKTIDIHMPVFGPHAGGSLLGIYKLEGDTLTVTLSCDGGINRPTEFTTKPALRRARTIYVRKQN